MHAERCRRGVGTADAPARHHVVGVAHARAQVRNGGGGDADRFQQCERGDARSTWDDGAISHVNQTAEALGASVGMSVPDFSLLMIARAGRQR